MKSVIELVKTTQGYSIVENGQEVNKAANKNVKEKTYVAPKSRYRPTIEFTQQNFTIYPYLYAEAP